MTQSAPRPLGRATRPKRSVGSLGAWCQQLWAAHRHGDRQRDRRTQQRGPACSGRSRPGQTNVSAERVLRAERLPCAELHVRRLRSNLVVSLFLLRRPSPNLLGPDPDPGLSLGDEDDSPTGTARHRFEQAWEEAKEERQTCAPCPTVSGEGPSAGRGV